MNEARSGTIGRSVQRREDLRFVTGRGRYVADLALDRALHLAVVRSPHAHAYDADGQVLTGTLMDYPLPRADTVPAITVASCDSPSPLDPLGLKGTGEGSAVPGPAAIANAVADALGAESPDLMGVPLRAHALARRS